MDWDPEANGVGIMLAVEWRMGYGNARAGALKRQRGQRGTLRGPGSCILGELMLRSKGKQVSVEAQTSYETQL